MTDVITLKALHDNYIYLYPYDSANAVTIDPCDTALVLKELQQRKLTLTMALVTHHHFDHTAGIGDLKKQTNCQVIAPDAKITGLDKQASDGDIIQIGSEEIEVIATPGHTRTSVCYYLRPSNKKGVLWTGDTLFIGGCGRIFECGAETMYNSLQRIVALPDDTLIYCGHNYTAENYEFALSIEPDNETIKQHLLKAQKADKQGKPTVPSTIADEKKTNVFLRADSPQTFAELRKKKDFF